MFEVRAFVFGLLAVAACAGSLTSSTPQEDVVRCYEGTVMLKALGEESKPDIGMLRRTVDPSARAIVDEHYFKSPGFTKRTNTWVVSGRRFTAQSEWWTERGTLTGPAWDWDGWTATAIDPDGRKVTVAGRINDRAITISTHFANGNNGPFISQHMRYVDTNCEGFDARVAALEAPSAP